MATSYERWITPLSFVALTLVWCVSYISRGLAPIDETRYVAVAWEMWSHNSFIIPLLNGEYYTHKPPLLFWLVHLGWSVFGVNEWWPRLLPVLFSMGALQLTATVGRMLWPAQPAVRRLAPVILLSGIYWLGLSLFVAFDVMLTFFALAALVGLLLAWRNRERRGWILCSLAMGFGLLAKGPAILIPVLFTALSLPLWIDKGMSDRQQWYLSCGAALLGALAIGLAWLGAAILTGGSTFAEDLLWKATAGRIHNAFAHARPTWWYIPALVIMLMPWTLSGAWWRGIWWAGKSAAGADQGARLCLVWVIPTFVVFSFISGKQPHYLLPTLPLIALLAVRGMAAQPAGGNRVIGPALAFASIIFIPLAAPLWPDLLGDLAISPAVYYASAAVLVAIALATVWTPAITLNSKVLVVVAGSLLTALTLHLGIVREQWSRLDTTMVGKLAAEAQRKGQVVGVKAPYYGEFTFAGRLTEPVQEIPYQHFPQWAEQNSNGLVILYTRYHPGQRFGPLLYTQRLQGRYVSVLRARNVIGNEALARNCNDFYGNLSCAEKFI